MREPADNEPIAPQFADPEALEFDADEREDIADMVLREYRDGVNARKTWNENHLVYDQMKRGQVDKFNPRPGPWPNSAHLHVQAPFWLVDSINVRLVNGIWNQNPLVVCEWEDPGDQPVSERAAHRVEWHLQPKRMSARSIWERISDIRCIHGTGNGYVTYAKSKYRVPILVPPEDQTPVLQFNPDGTPQIDDLTGEPVMMPPEFERIIEERTRYDGPTIYPLEWDDVVTVSGCMNLQPNDEHNPGGAHHVIIRAEEYLNFMLKKERRGTYTHMLDDDHDDVEWWRSHYPSQDGFEADPENRERQRQQEDSEGINRTQEITKKDALFDPRYEVLVRFGPYALKNDDGETADEECVFFVCRSPRLFLGGFRLSDIVWTGKRPIIELHYKKVSNRYYSMGVMEIVRSLSEELDTIHNMRIDVGWATNLPWYFYKEASMFNPAEHTLRPMKGIPIDDPASVRFPQMQNVTTFYHQEETLLLSLIERVMGVTDLFLGVSPTTGAAARHATGYVGAQQEGMARMSEVLESDAQAFAFLCSLVYDLDIQYGPEERAFRLAGTSETIAYDKMTRDDLWFQGTYDFRIGGSHGAYSQHLQQQRAQAVLAAAAQSPLTNQSLARRWEVEAQYYRAVGLRTHEIEAIIGPKNAVQQSDPMDQDRENNMMAEFAYGYGTPAPIHPNDNDLEHVRKTYAFLASDAFNNIGRPNEPAFMQHAMMHQQQQQMKQAQQAQMAAASQAGQPRPQGGPQGAMPSNRAAAQIENVPSNMGATMSDIYAGQTGQIGGAGNGQGGPPQLPSFLRGG